ncbi:unnamed protein product [Moneuplotes crassus]|uniref:Major facilitator superfamily (MFS) profile domain-containing protein n=1 Tax=Euplotes crassus TaxID=5936 RepID=A0AAD1X9R6_EUPCR|nr:unnamed protein product [Moneuplotes crassus]
MDQPEDDSEDIINSSLNKVKTYRWFFFLGIIPIILSFAFSDLIVDSLNFLELMPLGLECKTSKMSSNGEVLWVSCSINRICNQKHGDNIIRDDRGIAVSRKAQGDYYSLQNWVENMEIQCKSNFQVGAIGSAAFVGMTIGSILGAGLSAKYGRKLIYIGGLILTSLSLIIVTAIPTYYTGIFALLVYGIGVFPRMTIGYVYALEITPERATRTLGMLMFVGECTTIIFSNLYLVLGGRNALFFVWISLAFSVSPLIFTIILPESPKYLHSVKNYEGAKKSLQKIAALNGQKGEDFSDYNPRKRTSMSHTGEVDEKVALFGFLDLWRDKTSLKNTIAMAYLWGFYTFGHHCLIFMEKYFPGDKYMNGLMIAIAVTIAPLLTRVIQVYMSSKSIYVLFSCLSILFSALHMMAFSNDSIPALVMVVLVAICIDAIGFTNYYVEFEYFNPKIATLAYGICSLVGRGSAIFAPLVVEELDDTMFIFFFMSIVALLSIVFIEKPAVTEFKNENQDDEKKNKEIDW